MINARLQVVEDQVEQAKKVDDGVRKRIKSEPSRLGRSRASKTVIDIC